MYQLATSLISTKWEDYHTSTIQAAKLVLIDTIGALVAGLQYEESQMLLTELEIDGEGQFEVIGSSIKTTLYNAALIHGVASVAIEMDEGNQWSKGHPAAHVVPVMLTYIQKLGRMGGKEFIITLIKAYEACSRFGRATTLLPEAHAHGTWGTMGAAATALLMEKVSADDFVKGINLSATFALPTMWNAALEGALIRNVYAGHAIEMGIKSTAFLKSNHLAPKNNVQHVFNSVIGTNFDEQSLNREKHAPWDIELNYFKPYAFCRYAHAPIDAFRMIIQENQLTADKIERVNVSTYSRASTLDSQDYCNLLSAKFSIPHALAAWLHEVKADHTVFSNDILQNPSIRKFANKVFVVCSSELEKEYPKIMPAIVEVIDTEGKKYAQRIDIANGGPGKNLSEQQIKEKFCTLTGNVYSKEQQGKIISWIMNIENHSNLSELIHLCVLEKN